MTLAQYWVILLRRWKLIVFCFLVVGAGAYLGSKLMTPLYQSTTLVQITIRSVNNQADYTSLLASEQLVQTEADLATSDPVLREVASHYPDMTVEQLSKEVTSASEPNTQLFEIDVVDASATKAAVLANDIAATLIKQQIQLAEQNDLQSQQQIQQDLQITQQQINTTITQIATLQANKGDPAKISTLKVLLSSLLQHYNQVQAALAQLELTEAQNSSFLRIAQPAHPALNPVRPNVLLNTAAALLVGLLLGMLLAVLFEQLDTRVRTAEALSQLLDWSVLATIWQIRPSKKETAIHPKGRDVNIESYRILRTNIGFSAVDKPLRTLVVTSASPRDGKSVIAANLAIFMAKAGKNTLLIDADLRRPRQHEQFGLPAHAMGFSNAILACSVPNAANLPSYEQPLASTTPKVSSSISIDTETSLDRFIHIVDIPNLCIMPSGPLPPNPPELLDSKAMQRFHAALAGCGAEVVIFDTPPLLGLSDASILASKVDGTLFIVDITRANKGNLKQVKALLGQAGAHVLGCVVNKQRRNRKDSVYSYYYGTGEQSSKSSHSRKDANFAAISPVTSPTSKKPETQSQLDPFDMSTVKTIAISHVEAETQSQPDLLDGKKGG